MSHPICKDCQDEGYEGCRVCCPWLFPERLTCGATCCTYLAPHARIPPTLNAPSFLVCDLPPGHAAPASGQHSCPACRAQAILNTRRRERTARTDAACALGALSDAELMRCKRLAEGALLGLKAHEVEEDSLVLPLVDPEALGSFTLRLLAELEVARAGKLPRVTVSEAVSLHYMRKEVIKHQIWSQSREDERAIHVIHRLLEGPAGLECGPKVPLREVLTTIMRSVLASQGRYAYAPKEPQREQLDDGDVAELVDAVRHIIIAIGGEQPDE